MQLLRRSAAGALLAAVFAAFAVAGPAGAEDLPFVDGEMWGKTAAPLKRAYLIGVGNLLNAEYAYQQEMGPPPDKQSSIGRVYEGIEEMTLDECVSRIDAWYKKNPEKKATTVLEVIWLDMVTPNLPPDRRY